MRSYSVTAFGGAIEPMERATPEPQGTEALVRVSHCGVCHTDVHIWKGYFDLGGGNRLEMGARGIDLPMTLGHEAYGEIVAVGPEGDQSQIGRRGVVFPWIGCGACAACAAGDENLCMTPRFLGIFRPGGYGDHVMVPSARYVVEMPGVDPALAATYACSGLTAMGALEKARPFGPGKPLVLIGAGGVGLAAVALLTAEGVTDYAVVDIDDGRLAAARSLGAPVTVNANAPDAAAQLTADGPVQAVIDFVGAEQTTGFGIPLLRKGGAYIVVGLYGGAMTVPIPTLPLQARRIEGAYVGNLATLEKLAALVKTGRVPPIPVEERPWAACAHTLTQLERGAVTGRVVLDLSRA